MSSFDASLHYKRPPACFVAIQLQLSSFSLDGDLACAALASARHALSRLLTPHPLQMLRSLSLSLSLSLAAGHGSMIMPPARNSVDADLPAWSHGKNPPTGLIEPYSCKCKNSTSECSSGQSCFWFSQGCSVGCDACTGNGTRMPNLDHCPANRSAGFDPLTMPGALLPKYRSINLNATPGSISDIWKFNPWRAPGKAPVFDSCGTWERINCMHALA